MDETMKNLMNYLRQDPEYKKESDPVNEESKKPDPSKPNVDSELLGLEDYEDEDLNKVKSKTLKDPGFSVRQVKDKEVETPIPPTRAPARESKGSLYLCTECAKTFRSLKGKCPVSEDHCVETIVAEKKAYEGILDLVGEVEGLSRDDEIAVRSAIEAGHLKNEWPEDGEMIDALSSLEDLVDPMKELDADIKELYLKHVLVPKALTLRETTEDISTKTLDPGLKPQDVIQKYKENASVVETEEAIRITASDLELPLNSVKELLIKHGVIEGKVPDKDDDDAETIKKLTEDRNEWRDKVISSLGEVLENTNLGYFYSASRKHEDGTLVYEFTSVSGGPAIEVHVKSSPASEVQEDVETLPGRRPSVVPDEDTEETPTREKRPRRVTPLRPEPGQTPEPKGQNPDVVLFKKVRGV